MGYQLELIHVSKLFGDVRAVDDVSLSIQHGEFLTLLRPSGSGKTTTLNMIAGFDIPSRGDILLENEDITTVAPNDRGIGMVFQNYALFPHMTVADNIAFPLKMRKTPADKIQQLIQEALELVKLPGFERRYPHQLSGGQQQRIALARALAPNPRLLMLDEPFSSLDVELREGLAREVREILKREGTTAILVTHDQSEAFAMAGAAGIERLVGVAGRGTEREHLPFERALERARRGRRASARSRPVDPRASVPVAPRRGGGCRRTRVGARRPRPRPHRAASASEAAPPVDTRLWPPGRCR